METIVAEKQIKNALTSKMTPATKYLLNPGDTVPVYRELSGKWEGPFTDQTTTPKRISVTDVQAVNMEYYIFTIHSTTS